MTGRSRTGALGLLAAGVASAFVHSRASRLTLAAGLALAVLLSLGCSKDGPKENGLGRLAVDGEATVPVRLLYPAPGGRLGEEDGAIPEGGDVGARAGWIVEALLAGPREEGLYPIFGEGVMAGTSYATADGTVFIDLVSTEGSGPPASGSQQELLTVYSLVNTILINEPEAQRVVILWNGNQRPTLAGHVDLTRPLTLNSRLVPDLPDAALAAEAS